MAKPQSSQKAIPTGRCEDKGPHPSTAPPPEHLQAPHPAPRTLHPAPHPRHYTIFPEKRTEKPYVCQSSKTNEQCPLWAHLTPGKHGPGRSVPTILGGGWTRLPRTLGRVICKFPEMRSNPRDEGQTLRLRCWRTCRKPWWESHTDPEDCWPSGWGPSSSGLGRAGGGSAPIYVNRVSVHR